MILASNPFATRHTRPGRVEPLDAQGKPVDVESLLDRLATTGGHAAIVGPHGSGKSTLLLWIATALESRGAIVERVRLRRSRDTGFVLAAIYRVGETGSVCVDSWECLGALSRILVRLFAIMRGCQLVVTSHSPGGMRVLTECATTPLLLESVVERLPGHRDWYGPLIRHADVQAAFFHQGGDIRAAIGELYDVFERRCRSVAPQRS